MKYLKYIGQLLAAIVYTPIYTGIMYLVMVFPTMWIITLSFWKMLIALFFLAGIIEGCVALLQTFGMFPFAWITKSNKIARGISTALCTLLPICNAVSLWSKLLEYGTFGVVSAVIISGLLLQFIWTSVVGILSIGSND